MARWFAAYGLALLAAGAYLAVVLAEAAGTEPGWIQQAGATFAGLPPAIKLLGFAAYLSLCCTFLPLPTAWIVAAVAARESAVAPQLWSTVLLVAAIGAAGSTVANLNDYHVFTWMLRSRRIGRVRNTRAHTVAARWFHRAPGFILVVFNIVPIPVDVVRMLAASCRYPRLPFAAANFAGRLVRYGVIAAGTYLFDLGYLAAIVLLGLAVALAVGRGGLALVRRARMTAG